MRILLASGNPKKRREFERLLGPLGVALEPPRDLPEVIEDGATFEANARKKALETAAATGAWCLADDSGLEVDALGGAPGVRSARYAGVHGDDAANNARLLVDLEAVGAGLDDDAAVHRPHPRAARFVCALCLARPDGRGGAEVAAEVRGTAEGRILRAPRGSHDFGYDPLFLFSEPGHAATGRGFAELEPEEKGAVSHRGRALAALAGALMTLLAEAGGR